MKLTYREPGRGESRPAAPRDWPLADHEESNAETAKAKVASGWYTGETPKAAAVPPPVRRAQT